MSDNIIPFKNLPHQRQTAQEMLSTQFHQALEVKGAIIEVQQDDAEDLGFFDESALDLEEALDSRFDDEADKDEG